MTLAVDRVRAATEGARSVLVVCSENPMHDSGGGQRSAQLTTRFLERDHAVVFVSRGVSTESVDLELRFDHPRLVEASLEDFVRPESQDAVALLLSRPRVTFLTQVAVGPWALVLDQARKAGAVTLYDCVDRWASEMGWGWFDGDLERRVASDSELLTASSPALVRHVEELTERHTELVPNGFDADLFRTGGTHPRPADLPEGRIVLFVGALWGSWLDWPLVRTVAAAMPEDRFVFIGDHRGDDHRLPSNCTFLGLKPLTKLSAYHEHSEVAFLPWRVTETTHAMSPLTVYEHVATGLPVVAPPIEPLRGMPGVIEATGASAFVTALGRHGRSTLTDADRSAMEAFAAENSWSERAERILELAAAAHATPAADPRIRAARPKRRSTVSVVVPSYNHGRFIGEAVDGVRDQSLPVGELLVIDDGSSDDSVPVLADHTFPGMRVVTQRNRGAHETINRAVRISGGDWVAVLNSDDVYEPEWIESAWAVAREEDAALVFGRVSLIDGSGAPLPADHPTAVWYAGALERTLAARSLADALAHDNVAMTTSNFFFHKELWRVLGGFAPYRWVHDYDFLLRALQLCPERIVFAPEVTGVRYRIHESNTISESTERALAERARMIRTVRDPLRRLRSALARPGRRATVRAALAAPPLDPVARDPVRATEAPTVGLVLRSGGAGGLEEVVGVLTEGLRREGLRCAVLCTHGGGPLVDRLRATGVPVTVCGGDAEEWRLWAQLTAPDVISTHYAELGVLEALHGQGAPLVETVHNTYAWHDDEAWDLERRKAELLAGTVAVSDLVARYYLRHCPRAPVPEVIPNAIHPARAARVPRRYARRRLGIAEDRPVFVHLGRVTEQKNLPGLLEAFADFIDETPAARLLLAGPEEGRELERARAVVPELFARGQVRHLPPVTVVGPLLSAADAYVSSSFYEGWSIAASEALWVGRPVLLSACGGSAELIGAEGERGRLLPNPLGDPLAASPATVTRPDPASAAEHRRAMTGAMAEIARSREAWTARAPEIRAWARETLAPMRMATRYAEVLRSAAGLRGSRA